MTGNIQRPLGDRCTSRIDIGNKQAFFLAHGAGYDLTSRRDYDGIPGIYPFLRSRVQAILFGKISGNIVMGQHNTAADYPTTPLTGNML